MSHPSRATARSTVSSRVLALVCLAAVTSIAVVYMAREVPIKVYSVPPNLRPHLALVALDALLAMLIVDAVILLAVYWQRGRAAFQPAVGQSWNGLPAGLGLKRVSWQTLAATALASSALLVFGVALLGLPLWASVLIALLPWVPLYVTEAGWQYRHYGVYVFFGTLVALQLGHLAEHIVQNFQLFLTHGNVAASRGVFGQLDIEAVHFYWNILVWLGSGALLFRYGLRNLWLTAAFLIGGLHSVEHMYMYWLYVTDHAAYVSGGSNGILAAGGLIGSVLARPYLHLVYNLLEITPLAIAYWDESRLVYDRLAAIPSGSAVPA